MTRRERQTEKPEAKTGPRPKQLVTAEFQGLPVGRDKTVVPPDGVEALAALGCRDREIANFYGIDETTLKYNFTENLVKGREDLKISLRRSMLHNACKNMNAAVQIFLAKNILGYRDQPVETENTQPLPWTD